MDLDTLKTCIEAGLSGQDMRVLYSCLANSTATDKDLATSLGMAASNFARSKKKIRHMLLPQKRLVLDACCGSCMWLESENTFEVLKGDIRQLNQILCDGRELKINPDIVFDFRKLPFRDNIFDAVLFDPPHLARANEKSWLVQKYGRLNPAWRDDLRLGFFECFRVLKVGHPLVFKWNVGEIPINEVLRLSPIKPIVGTQKTDETKTYWKIFIK